MPPEVIGGSLIELLCVPSLPLSLPRTCKLGRALAALLPFLLADPFFPLAPAFSPRSCRFIFSAARNSWAREQVSAVLSSLRPSYARPSPAHLHLAPACHVADLVRVPGAFEINARIVRCRYGCSGHGWQHFQPKGRHAESGHAPCAREPTLGYSPTANPV